VRPGTDLAVALAMIHVIINEGIYDKEFVETYCKGFDELAAHVEKYTPEWAERDQLGVCKRIRRVPDLRSHKAPVSFMALTRRIKRQQARSTTAFCILQAITGNVMKPAHGFRCRFSDSGSEVPFEERPIGRKNTPI